MVHRHTDRSPRRHADLAGWRLPRRPGSIQGVDHLLAWYRVSSSVGAVVALIVANAIPLFGALFLGWNVWMILIVYWLENGVVGVFNVLKMLRAEGDPGDTSGWTMNGKPMNVVAKGAVVGFFVMHYGIFWAVHGVFVLTLPLFGSMGGEVDMLQGFDPLAIVLAVIALAISHGVSYWFNYLGRGEYKRTSAAGQMWAPYGRLVVLHITIIVGGLAISMTGAPAAVLAILVGLKTVLDIGFHLAQHRKVTVPPETVMTA
jgi:hypothetical protein